MALCNACDNGTGQHSDKCDAYLELGRMEYQRELTKAVGEHMQQNIDQRIIQMIQRETLVSNLTDDMEPDYYEQLNARIQHLERVERHLRLEKERYLDQLYVLKDKYDKRGQEYEALVHAINNETFWQRLRRLVRI